VAKPWLADFSWEAVTVINSQLCETKHALHKPTSDGHDTAQSLWKSYYRKAISLAEAVELCRECHRIAPFCFFNGNTFVAIIGIAIQKVKGLDVTERYVLQSIVGHIVAGTANAEEERQFRELLTKLE